MEQALLKSEVEEKRENMWVERLSSERKEEASCEEKDPPPSSSAVAAEYENPPKTEAEAIFRLLDVNRQGFVTRKVTRVFRSDALKHFNLLCLNGSFISAFSHFKDSSAI